GDLRHGAQRRSRDAQLAPSPVAPPSSTAVARAVSDGFDVADAGRTKAVGPALDLPRRRVRPAACGCSYAMPAKPNHLHADTDVGLAKPVRRRRECLVVVVNAGNEQQAYLEELAVRREVADRG